MLVSIDAEQLAEEPLQERVQEADSLAGPVTVTTMVPVGVEVTVPVLLTVKVQSE
jgi:hypothetical protein